MPFTDKFIEVFLNYTIINMSGSPLGSEIIMLCIEKRLLVKKINQQPLFYFYHQSIWGCVKYLVYESKDCFNYLQYDIMIQETEGYMMGGTKMNLLIVDDESSAVDAVMHGVNWRRLPFDEIFSASDKKSAAEILLKQKVDVLLCDIEMPGGSGLELLEWVNSNKESVCCIFMTCHADFHYAQKAVHLGGFEYILKPLDFKMLEKALSKAAEKVEKQHQLELAEQYWNYGKKEEKGKFWRRLFSGDVAAGKENIRNYLMRVNMELPEGKSFLPIYVSPREFIADMSQEDIRLFSFALRNIADEIFEKAGIVHDVEDYKENKILIILTLTNLEELLSAIEDACREFTEAAEKYLNIQITCYIGKKAEVHELPEMVGELQRKDYSRMLQKSGMISGRDGEISEPSLVERVCVYIKENLGDPLTVEEIAAYVHLNPDYLNRVFKNEKGMALGKYVLQTKIGYAKWLLVHTDKKIGDIAAEVGYYNYSSFHRAFMKETGESPQVWRHTKRS